MRKGWVNTEFWLKRTERIFVEENDEMNIVVVVGNRFRCEEGKRISFVFVG